MKAKLAKITKKTKTKAKTPKSALVFFDVVTKTPFFSESIYLFYSIFSKTKENVNKVITIPSAALKF